MSIKTGPGRPVREVERFLDDPRGRRILNQVVVLGDRAGDLDHRCLLKRIGADHVPRHLAGDRHQRDRIHLGVGQTGDEIDAPGPEVAITTPGLPVARA